MQRSMQAAAHSGAAARASACSTDAHARHRHKMARRRAPPCSARRRRRAGRGSPSSSAGGMQPRPGHRWVAGGHAQLGCPARRSVWGGPSCSPAGSAGRSHPARPPPAAQPACHSNPLCRCDGPSEGWREGGGGGRPCRQRPAGGLGPGGAAAGLCQQPPGEGRSSYGSVPGLGVHLEQPPRSCTGRSPPPAAPRRRLHPAGTPRPRAPGGVAGAAP